MFNLRSFLKSNRPGVYFRVLKEGLIATGQEFKLIDREKIQLSTAKLFRLAQGEAPEEKMIEQYLQIRSLPNEWRKEFESII